MKPIEIFPTRDEFYNWRGGRMSDERDYGIWNINDLEDWDAGGYSTGRDIRVAVVADTGDVYAQAGLGLEHPAALLGTIVGPDVLEEAKRIFRSDDDRSVRRPLSWFMERLASCQIAQARS